MITYVMHINLNKTSYACLLEDETDKYSVTYQGRFHFITSKCLEVQKLVDLRDWCVFCVPSNVPSSA